jgi:transcriptional regulator with XRE-family HTH domain
MTQNLNQVTTATENIARTVREARDHRNWSGQQLAEAMSEAGVQWDRNIVANLESGRRRSVSAEELLALGFVLDICPLHLLIPTAPADDEWFAITPHWVAPAPLVREWLRGRHWMPHPGGSDRTYWTWVPDDEWNPPTVSDAERDARRAKRLARLQELADAGVMDLTEVKEAGDDG